MTANTPQVTATVEQGPPQSISYAIYKHPIAQTVPPHIRGLGELAKFGLAIGSGFALAMLISLLIWRRYHRSKLKVSSGGQEGNSGDSSGKTGTHGPQPGGGNGASSTDGTYEPSASHDTSNTEPMSSSISSTEVSDIGLWGHTLGNSNYGLPWNVARGENQLVRPLDEEELLNVPRQRVPSEFWEDLPGHVLQMSSETHHGSPPRIHRGPRRGQVRTWRDV